ncbi:hypothetical protein M407DRAFT_144337 [Tulasnella calospora MUT 4182]|uniref:Uncharacterized protein n=1 Tax=Tulasnella calospora MUT 4182 TaxID=1051891 RepID=A0A0C3QSI8_9AGAM|nr:hypothetical protein M407DRAFT_144337 [Tulasnella calospora MUT 4182]
MPYPPICSSYPGSGVSLLISIKRCSRSRRQFVCSGREYQWAELGSGHFTQTRAAKSSWVFISSLIDPTP